MKVDCTHTRHTTTHYYPSCNTVAFKTPFFPLCFNCCPHSLTHLVARGWKAPFFVPFSYFLFFVWQSIAFVGCCRLSINYISNLKFVFYIYLRPIFGPFALYLFLLLCASFPLFLTANSIYYPLCFSQSPSVELILPRPNGRVQLATAHANIWCVQSSFCPFPLTVSQCQSPH